MIGINARALQAALGVSVDGAIGPVTLTALFRWAGATLDRAQELALAANVHFTACEFMLSRLRLAHFMAQLIHESGGFRYMEEIASGALYEGRADLGNTQPGDGRLFKGRGPIQITGRANYRTFGKIIGIDIERNPSLAAVPSIGLHLACTYWMRRDLNRLADRDDLIGITRAINGGLNGLDGRRAALGRMMTLLT